MTASRYDISTDVSYGRMVFKVLDHYCPLWLLRRDTEFFLMKKLIDHCFDSFLHIYPDEMTILGFPLHKIFSGRPDEKATSLGIALE